MRPISVSAAALAALALAFSAQGASPPPETPLITNGSIVVDAGDFDGNMLRVPENRRAEMRTSYDRIATIVDNMYVSRSLAQRARAMGLDKDPLVQRRLQQVQDGVLADLYVQKTEKAALNVDLEGRVRELYKAEPAKYTSPELVSIQHILINLNGRTREAALERATKVANEAKAGADFLLLASRYSDDPDLKRNKGNLGLNGVNSFLPPVNKAIAGMTKPGEISDPIETDLGYHVVRFGERKKPELVKFEVVRDRMIEAEKEKLLKMRTENLIQQVREEPSIVIHRDNIESLVLAIDPEMMRRASERASTKK